jgi:acetolactate synthase-1/2/3 large subunit
MKIRGGMLLARALQEKGVQQVFTLSGGFCNPALEGFMDCGIPVINAPHEQTAGHLADGHTRITRKPAVCLVGPEGFAGAVPAMMEAWGERSPVIFVTGSSTLKRQGSGGFKEIDDVSIAAPLTKYSVSITDGERISEFVDRAWKIAVGGYPGAVHLSMPVDIMYSSYEEDAMRDERPFERGAGRPPRAWPCPQDLAPVLDAIAQAQKPIIVGGHGIWWSGAEAALEDCARRLNIPVFNVPYHQKLLSEASDVYMGLADVHQYHPSNQAIEESDVVLMVGARLDNQMNFGNPPLFPASTRLICVNGSHEELEMNRAADLALLSDPGAFFSACGELEPKPAQWIESNRAWRARWVEDMIADIPQLDDDAIHPLQLALEVQDAMNAGDWLVIDGGNTHFWSEISVNIAGQRGLELGNILHPGTFSMLGVGVPFASAAKLNNPRQNVVVISGDGAFLSGGSSIEAAFQEQLPIVVVIDNNGGLDCISQQQERLFSNRQHFATDFRDIPFHSMFEGLGGYGELVEKRADIAPDISPIVLATTSKRDKASIE